MVVNNVLFRLGNYVKEHLLLRYPFAPSVEFVGVGLPDDPVILQGKMTSPLAMKSPSLFEGRYVTPKKAPLCKGGWHLRGTSKWLGDCDNPSVIFLRK